MRAPRHLWAWLACLLASSAVAAPAHTQPRSAPAPIEDILPLANDPDDPIGLDPDQANLGAGQPTIAKPAAPKPQEPAIEPPPSAARSDVVLNAAQQVHETSHRIAVDLDMGMAQVTTTLVLESRAGKPAEAVYKLVVPEGAALATVKACNAQGCKAPSVSARLVREDDSLKLVMRAAPVRPNDPLTLTLAYLAPAPQHGGVVRLRLPARGMDPRIARSELLLRAHGLDDPRVNDAPAGTQPTATDPWAPTELSARAKASPALDARAVRASCGKRTCLRAYAAAAPRPPTPVDLVLAIDASPSMEGPARSRLLTTLATILATAPHGSRVRALMFAARAQTLVADAQAPAELRLQSLAPVTFEAELGSATRFEAAWETIRTFKLGGQGLRKLVVIVGDGGLTTGPARPFEFARRAGIEVSVVNVADRRSTAALAHAAWLTRGTVIDAGLEAAEAARGFGEARLQERVAALFAPTAVHRIQARGASGHAIAPTLRAGESITTDAALTLDGKRLRPAPPRGPLEKSLQPTNLGWANATETTAAPRAASELGAGMPSSPLLDMLRLRIMPAARGCFRRDRAGRADYQVRATFVFTLAEREIVTAGVEGAIADELRACLLQAVDTLAVPRFSGRVVVRYPLFTEREALPAQVELSAHTAGDLDTIIGNDAGATGGTGTTRPPSLDALHPHLHTAPSKPAGPPARAIFSQ